MARKRQSKVSAGLQPAVGEQVLIGTPGISMPRDWFLATILWSDPSRGEVVTEHCPPGGNTTPYRQVLSVAHVRAIGTPRELERFRASAAKAVETHWRKVRKCESALSSARSAVWARLDEIGAKARRLEPSTAP